LEGKKAQQHHQAPEGLPQQLFASGQINLTWEAISSSFQSFFPAQKFEQMKRKADEKVLSSLSCLLEILSQHSKTNQILTQNSRVGIFIGSAFSSHNLSKTASLSFFQAQAEWSEFWSQPKNNSALQKLPAKDQTPPPINNMKDLPKRLEWQEFWAQRSPELQILLKELVEIEEWSVDEQSGHDKLTLMRVKQQARKKSLKKFNAPQPPWECIDPKLIWNLPNASAAQISILLNAQGPTWGLNGACSSFILALKQGFDLIRSGEIDAALVGAQEEAPSAEMVSAFYNARLLACGKENLPFTSLRGTRVSGGGCLWLIGRASVLEKKFGLPHSGVTLKGLGISSDADHIITPSPKGPLKAIYEAFGQARIDPKNCHTWDLHATGTPGDLAELLLCEKFLSPQTVLTARKGLFGHGMGVSGGWELTAQLAALKNIENHWHVLGSGIFPDLLHPTIKEKNYSFALNQATPLPHTPNQPLILGKLSLGVGGITGACILQVDPQPFLSANLFQQQQL
jgi:hypothetical protein